MTRPRCSICGKEIERYAASTVDIKDNRWAHNKCMVDKSIRELEPAKPRERLTER